MLNAFPLFQPLAELVNSTVSGGSVLALASVCALQYVLHFSRIARAEREAQTWRDQTGRLATELEALEREQSFSKLEIGALRDFLAERDLDRSIEQFLKRFIPAARDGLAAFVECAGGQCRVSHSRGLSAESRTGLQIARSLQEQIECHRLLVLEGRALYDGGFLETLSPADRAKIRRVLLFAASAPNDPLCVFLTTQLFPANLSREQQISFVNRLLPAIWRMVSRAQSLDRQEHELRATNDRLEFQALVDQFADDPHRMLDAGLELLVEKLGCDRGLLSITFTGAGGPDRMVVRTGQTLPGTLATQWESYEERLIQTLRGKTDVLLLDTHALGVVGIHNLISSALVIPVPRTPRTNGALCLTRRGGRPLGEMHLPLAQWVVEFLAGSLERILSRAVIERQARQDGLTDLANRRTFDQQIAREVEQASRSGNVCSLLLLDLDHFKSINDLHGHLAGDEVLRETARLLEEELLKLRSGDRAMLARYGGEELAVLLPGIGTAGALRIAECMRAAVENAIITHDGRPLRVTLSAGVATYPTHAANVQTLVAAADAGLYQAKKSGRNQVSCALAELV